MIFFNESKRKKAKQLIAEFPPCDTLLRYKTPDELLAIPQMSVGIEREAEDLDARINSVAKLGPAVIPVLLELLASGNENLRPYAPMILTRISDKKRITVQALKNALYDKNPHVRKESILAYRNAALEESPAQLMGLLGANGENASQVCGLLELENNLPLDSIMALASDRRAPVDSRTSCIGLLGKKGVQECIPALISALDDPEPEVVMAASMALGKELKAKEAIPAMLAALERYPFNAQMHGPLVLLGAGDEVLKVMFALMEKDHVNRDKYTEVIGFVVKHMDQFAQDKPKSDVGVSGFDHRFDFRRGIAPRRMTANAASTTPLNARLPAMAR